MEHVNHTHEGTKDIGTSTGTLLARFKANIFHSLMVINTLTDSQPDGGGGKEILLIDYFLTGSILCNVSLP